MEGVSEIDTQFFEIFRKIWPKLSNDQQVEVAKYLKSILDDRVKSAAKKAKSLPLDSEKFGEHLTETFLTGAYDTYTRWRLTYKILDISGHAENYIGQLKKFAEDKDGEIPLNTLRNAYAHKSRKLLNESHDTERCVQIRKLLRAQSANIDAILGSE